MNIDVLFGNNNSFGYGGFKKHSENTLDNLYKILQDKMLDFNFKKSEKYTLSLIQIMKKIDLELDSRKLNKKS